MEERIKKCFQLWNRTGSPDTFRKATIKSINPHNLNASLSNPEYIIARFSGLTIAEAKDALILAEEIRKSGIEKVMAKWEVLSQKLTYVSLARKRRKGNSTFIKDPKPSKKPKV